MKLLRNLNHLDTVCFTDVSASPPIAQVSRCVWHQLKCEGSFICSTFLVLFASFEGETRRLWTARTQQHPFEPDSCADSVCVRWGKSGWLLWQPCCYSLVTPVCNGAVMKRTTLLLHYQALKWRQVFISFIFFSFTIFYFIYYPSDLNFENGQPVQWRTLRLLLHTVSMCIARGVEHRNPWGWVKRQTL